MSSTATPPTVLITGANRGIGLELARQFAARGCTVIGTARDVAEARDLSAVTGRVEQLDVADERSVAALVQRLDGAVIDILVNNAGVLDRRDLTLDTVDFATMEQTLAVNTLGPLRDCQALLPNLRAGRRRVIVNMSSEVGSIEQSNGRWYAYRASKSAGIAGVVCDTRQANRLFPLFNASFILRQVIGGFATGLLVNLIGTENLLIVWAGTLIVAFIFSRAVLAHQQIDSLPQRKTKRKQPTLVQEMQRGFQYVRTSPLLTSISISTIFFSILYFSIALPFSRTITAQFPDENTLASFLGIFNGLSTAAAFSHIALSRQPPLCPFRDHAMYIRLPDHVCHRLWRTHVRPAL